MGALSKEVAKEKAMRKTEEESLESFEEKKKSKNVLQAKRRSVSKCSESSMMSNVAEMSHNIKSAKIMKHSSKVLI